MLPLKRYVPILSIAVVGVAFFGLTKSVKAESLYMDGYPSTFTTTTDKCVNIKNDTDGLEACNYSFTGATLNRYVRQYVHLPTGLSVSRINLYQQSLTAGGGVNDVIYLVLEDSTGTGVATSSAAMRIGGIEQDTSFVFSPAYTTNSAEVYSFRVHMVSATSNPAPTFRVSVAFFPTRPFEGNINNLNHGTYGTFTSETDFSTPYAHYDLWTRIYVNEGTELTIQEPADNEIITTNFVPLSGTCSEDFGLSIYNGVSYASSTDRSYQPVDCNAPNWTTGAYLFEGNWTALATSTHETAWVNFRSTATTTDEFIPYDFSDSPFAPEEGGNLGFWEYLYDWGITKGTLRPYSYIPQIGTVMYNALANPTSTDWLTSIPINYGNSTFNMPAIDSSLFDTIPNDYKNNLRTVSTIALSAGFIAYVWHLRNRFNG